MITCSICVAKKGFSLSDKDRIFETDEELADHLENVHGIPVARENETVEDAETRCSLKGITKDRNVCQCQDCKGMRNENINPKQT